ncbi:hypothetical protein [Fulvivirga sediminis]|uniref:Uncharacterized protein n=1 Tax=Fulvivirga sediminis TaxID=2803949 RepID=A0A937JZ68_9BACT|nr:hypothetical protein [Fulvivirga sediminis]MBL3654866.1 hypothetical protein [Fulvivirga sediminis]
MSTGNLLYDVKGNISSGILQNDVFVFVQRVSKNSTYYAFVPDQEVLYQIEFPLNERRRIKWLDKEGAVLSYNSDSEIIIKYDQSFKRVKKSE